MADTQENKIRKGQAFNLAVNDAVTKGRENDPTYIYKRFVYYYDLAAIVQGSDLDLIQQVINSKDFDKVMKELREVMK